MARKQVALLMGSFNPLHEGHLAIVRHINANFPDTEVRIVVSPESPFKEGLEGSAEGRLDAVRSAVASSDVKAEVSDVEFGLTKPYYTINTLRYLRDTEPDNDFVLVVGGDNIEAIEKWHEGRRLLQEFEVWVYPRPGYDAKAACEKYQSTTDVRGVKFLEGEMHNISSTQIRARDEYDVIIIGGGITGAGTARDCALRGLKTLLVEKLDITNGASGRNHGLLHSGARYAVGDTESARECIKENLTLKKIAPHCVEDRGGLFISLPEDGLEFQAKFVEACRAAGIQAEVLDPQEARLMEPSVNPALIGAVRIPDGSVDPFRLVLSNIVDAKAHGAEVRTFTEVTGFIKNRSRVVGVNLRDSATGETSAKYARMVVNAAGIWGARIAEMAGAHIDMYPAKGSLLVFGHRVNNMVINRCRKSADADILVPGESVTIIGTTSTRVPLDEVDDIRPTAEEVDILLCEGSKLAPALASTRILRAYAGVRPLVAADGDASGRSISRGIVLLDHSKRDGIEGFVTITGGKLATYRLMAETVTDFVCSALGVSSRCTTASRMLPVPLVRRTSFAGKLVCECENVTEEEIRKAVESLDVRDLDTLRKRTRLGMGTCQGQLCARRAAGLLPDKSLDKFLQERWKGMAAVAWGDTLREAQLMQWIYNFDSDRGK